jgi:menaquinone-dependent protoporphyrinogen IX oxidase
MDALVTCASRHGSPYDIARVFAEDRRAPHLEVDLRAAGHGVNGCDFDAVVLGGAICMRHESPETGQFVDRPRRYWRRTRLVGQE